MAAGRLTGAPVHSVAMSERFPPPRPTVLPSLMSADQMRVGEQVRALMEAGARVFHVDVMDAHFVPNLTLGSNFTRDLAALVHPLGGVVDVHLMVDRPGEMVDVFAEAADMISIHAEADPHPHRLLNRIREHGCAAGLALNPATPLEMVTELLDDLDYVNVLAVDPGFSGQSFIARTPSRVGRLRSMLYDRIWIEVDGGIDERTLPLARDAGARLFVSASSIFGEDDPVAAFAGLEALASR